MRQTIIVDAQYRNYAEAGKNRDTEFPKYEEIKTT